MKKASSLVMTAVFILTMLSGCMVDNFSNENNKGGSSSTKPNIITTHKAESPVLNNNNNSSSPEKSNETISEDNSSSPISRDEKNLTDVYLKGKDNFSEGRAWVTYSTDSNKNKAALIDTEGNILWKSESIPMVSIDGSEFKNGFAYFTLYSDHDAIKTCIIDSGGNVTYTIPQSNDFKILCHDNGLFLVTKHVSNFDVDEWQIATIDKNGSIVAPFKVLEVYDELPEPVESPSGDPPDPNYDYFGYLDYQEQLDAYNQYIYAVENRGSKIIKFDYDGGIDDHPNYIGSVGENIFCISSIPQRYYILLDIKTNEIIYNSNYSNDSFIEFLTVFQNGTAIVRTYDANNPYMSSEGDEYCCSLCTMDVNGTFTKFAISDWIEYYFDYADEYSEGIAYLSDERWGYKSSQGIENMTLEAFSTGSYINYEGEKIIEFPQYSDKKYYGFPFRNGHALMLIRGADDKTYYTVIDKEGNEMFAPKQCLRAYLSSDGKYVIAHVSGQNSTIVISDINGQSLVSIEGKKIGYNDIYDGVYMIGASYVNIEKKMILGKGLGSDYTFKAY